MRLHTLFATAAVVLLMSCDPPKNEPATATTTTPAAGAVDMNDTVALQGPKGMYVTCEIGRQDSLKNVLLCNRPSVGGWEKFLIVDQHDGTVALRAANGKFVSADRTRHNMLVADRDGVGGWETFQLVDAGNGRKALKASSNGRFVTADLTLQGDSTGLMIADRPEAHDWESFTVVAVRK